MRNVPPFFNTRWISQKLLCRSCQKGAEFFKGSLLAATNDKTQAIYKIDPVSGAVDKLLDRNLVKFSEGENMTIMTRDGKPVLLAMDMGSLFVNAFVREYDLSKFQ